MRNSHLVRIIALMITVILEMSVLSACTNETETIIPEGSLKVYCCDIAKSSLFWEYYVPQNTEGTALIDELIVRLGTDPKDSRYSMAKPAEIKIDDYYFGEDGQLILCFSDNYSKMDHPTEILCRAAVVKTLCQIPEVEYVEFYVNGQQLMLKNETPAGLMSDDSFIDNTGSQVLYNQNINLTVYFASLDGTSLVPAILLVKSNGLKPAEQLAFEILKDGPVEGQNDVIPVIPEGSRLNKLIVRDGTAYIDISAEFLSGVEGVSNETVLYSIVNTLTELSSITKVQFTIDGQTVKMYGDIPLNVSFERRPDLIVTEKAGETP